MSNIIQQPQILYFKYLFSSVYLCSRPSRPSLWGRSSCRGAATCWPPPPRGTGCWRWRHCSRSSSCRPPRPRADQSEEASWSRDLVSTNHSSPGVCGRGSASRSPWLSAPAARWNLGNKLYINIDIITICELHIDLLTEKVLLIKGKRNFFATLTPAAISHGSWEKINQFKSWNLFELGANSNLDNFINYAWKNIFAELKKVQTGSKLYSISNSFYLQSYYEI